MIVCICRAVSDRTIDAVIDDGAGTVAEVGERCGAGTCCGACRPAIAEMISEAGVAEANRANPAVAGALVALPTGRSVRRRRAV